MFLDENMHFTSYSENTLMEHQEGLLSKDINMAEYMPYAASYI